MRVKFILFPSKEKLNLMPKKYSNIATKAARRGVMRMAGNKFAPLMAKRMRERREEEKHRNPMENMDER